MTALIITVLIAIAATAGLTAGVRIGRRQHPDARRLRNYRQAVSVCRDLVSDDPTINPTSLTRRALDVVADDGQPAISGGKK